MALCLTPLNRLTEEYYNFSTSAIQLAAYSTLFFSCLNFFFHSILHHCAQFYWLRLTSKYFHSPIFEAAMGLLTSSTNHFSCLQGARSPMEVWKYNPHHLLLTFVFLGPVSDGPISSDPHSDRRSGPWVGKQRSCWSERCFFSLFNLSSTSASPQPWEGDDEYLDRDIKDSGFCPGYTHWALSHSLWCTTGWSHSIFIYQWSTHTHKWPWTTKP